MMSFFRGPDNVIRSIQLMALGGVIIIILACATATALVAIEPSWLFPALPTPTELPILANWATPRPTFTIAPTPLPPTMTPTSTSTPSPTATSSVVSLPSPTLSPTPFPTLTYAPIDPLTPVPPPVDFVVIHQRMRTNEENSWEGKVANNCGGDHTIYVQVVDAIGQPLPDIIVGDTYNNVRASSGVAGPGRLEIELWSNTMSLEVQGNIDGTPYASEQTLPLSTRDEDIPAEWLLAGGYCESMADCQLRQQTNGLCRGHYSYDITFQRNW